MTKYLITLGAHAMDDIPEHDMTAVAAAAHAVTQQAINAGVFVLAGGLQDQPASMVSPDGSVADGPRPEAIGGFMVVDVSTREEALAWAARVASACRCTQEVREIGPDPELDATLRAAEASPDVQRASER